MLLLVAESMAVRNAVLSQSPEFKEIRLSAYQDATTVYDLLAVATVRWGQIGLLQEVMLMFFKYMWDTYSFGEKYTFVSLEIGSQIPKG